MKDSAKSNLQTPKKEGFTRYDKTPSANKMVTPISEKKINTVINDNQAIFKSPMIGGSHLITGQNLNCSPTYQGYVDTPFQPLTFPCEYPNIDAHFNSPFKRDFKGMVHPIIHTQTAYPFKFQQYISNSSSPLQDKANNNQPEFLQNNFFQQHEEVEQSINQNGEEQKNFEKSNIETDLIFSEQNGISLLACETLCKDARDQDSNASGSVIMKKPKFIVEFKNQSELQDFKDSDEFKQLISKLNFSDNYFEFEIPSNESNLNGKSLFSGGSRFSKKNFSSQRTPPFKNQMGSKYISPNPYSRHQFMMQKNPPYQYPMNSYYYNQELPASANSPNMKNNILNRNFPNDARVIPRLYGPFGNNKPAPIIYQNKQLGKLLFDNNHEKEMSDNENSNSEDIIKNINLMQKKQESNSDDQSPQQDSKYNSVQKQTRKILKENDDKNDIFEDANTINFPLNEDQKQSLKDKHKKIHNKPNTTFLQQQIQNIKKNNSERKESKQNISSEIKEDIEEVQLKNPIIASSAKRVHENNECLTDQINEKLENSNGYALTTAKKARSICKNESLNQDSINKKRRHFDTPNIKKNEFSTPSTKKKYDLQQLQKSNQDQGLNKKSSTKNTLDSKTQSSKNSRSLQLSQKQNNTVSDFSSEITNNLKKQTLFNHEEEAHHSHSHSHSDMMCDHDHEHQEKSEIQDRDMMAEEEDLLEGEEEEDQNLQDVDENDKKECCGCKKTKCLKLYCECFQAKRYCVGTNCQGCLNKPQFEEQRKQAMELIQQRNSSAFEPKAEKSEQFYKNDSGSKATHTKGCNCKKSDCRKKYCECFQMGAKCTHLCKCYNCKNRHDSNSHFYSGSKQGMPIHSLYMDGVPSHIPPHPHLIGVPHQYPFRGSNQGPIIFQYPSMYHPHQVQNYGIYDNWNHYYNHQEYNQQRQGESSNNNNNSNNQSQQGQQSAEFDNTPRFNSVKRQQPIYQKSSIPVKDFQNSMIE